MSSKLSVQRIEELVRRRASTDRRMGYHWMLVPLLPVIVGIALVVSVIGIIVSNLSKLSNLQQQSSALPFVSQIVGLYVFAIFAMFLTLLLGAFAMYTMIERRNAHFRRQQQLFHALSSYVGPLSKDNDSADKFANLSEDSIFQERDRPAGVWAILYLFIFNLVGLIIAYSLTSDLRKHEERQLQAQNALTQTLSSMDLQPVNSGQLRSHARDPVLFVILTVITGGIFWLFWFYTLLKDYNNHFSDQAQFEDAILRKLKPEPAIKTCQSCGQKIGETEKFCTFCGAKQGS